MPAHILPEENAVAKYIENLDIADTMKSRFVKAIRSTGLTEEIVESVRQRLIKPAGEKDDPFRRGSELSEFTNLVKRWRIAKNKKQFHDRR
jgi:hypothetical protein